jgi:hypothetical protein
MKIKTFTILSAQLILVTGTVLVVIGAPLAYATVPYDDGYKDNEIRLPTP